MVHNIVSSVRVDAATLVGLCDEEDFWVARYNSRSYHRSPQVPLITHNRRVVHRISVKELMSPSVPSSMFRWVSKYWFLIYWISHFMSLN